MSFLNCEIKAKYADAAFARDYFIRNGAECKGTDFQTDTYFKVANGRLKLREGSIENCLIYYERDDQSGPKNSHFQLVHIEDKQGLKEVLEKSNGIKVIVRKQREIYYIKNVKFHIDLVPGLGNFIEIEASNLHHDIPEEALREQCQYYMKELRIRENDLIKDSYSDLLLELE